MRIRSVLFWCHLACGVVTGAVILLMSVTGVLLTYERQLVAWADRAYHSTAAPGVARMPIDALLARVQAQLPDQTPVASVAIAAAAEAPVTVSAGGATFFADAYSGQILGQSSPRLRQFMSSVRSWHRWFAVEGEGREAARAVTGWSNLAFLFIVGSGLYLWLPRRWSWSSLRAVLFFKRTNTGKARDFNWHNVFGIWSAVPLFIVVLCAVPMSFPWANALVYRAMGEQPPAGGGREGRAGGRGGDARGGEGRAERVGREAEGGAPRERGNGEAEGGVRRAESGGREAGGDGRPGRPRGEDKAAPATLDGVNALLARAQQQEPDWRTITLRLPNSPRAPLAFAIDRGDGGQPQLRSTLTLARRDGAVVSYQTFSQQSPARRVRSIMRFAHTGEVLGLTGQTIAGLASFGGVVLVYTGLSLAIRRLLAWTARRRQASPAVSRQAA